MIDFSQLDADRLVGIVESVENETGWIFEPHEAEETLRYTIRKAELNGEDTDYIFILFRSELKDKIMRDKINCVGRMNLCAQSVGIVNA